MRLRPSQRMQGGMRLSSKEQDSPFFPVRLDTTPSWLNARLTGRARCLSAATPTELIVPPYTPRSVKWRFSSSSDEWRVSPTRQPAGAGVSGPESSMVWRPGDFRKQISGFKFQVSKWTLGFLLALLRLGTSELGIIKKERWAQRPATSTFTGVDVDCSQVRLPPLLRPEQRRDCCVKTLARLCSSESPRCDPSYEVQSYQKL